MNRYEFKQVDVFTDEPFLGNPVAVVIGAENLSSREMQRIATWTNLSETTFLLRPTDSSADYKLRIFTTQRELPFAGHPTIGSVHAAVESGFIRKKSAIRQECRAGVLDCRLEEGDGSQKFWVRAPAAKVMTLDTGAQKSLYDGLRKEFMKDTPPMIVNVGPVWVVANMGTAETVAKVQPDLKLLSQLSTDLEATGVILFGASVDDVSAVHVRAFAPAAGIPEDPVCGSGNVSVAAYLVETGQIKQIGYEYLARQGMQVGRDGRVSIRVSENEKTIELGGNAVTCISGELRVPS